MQQPPNRGNFSQNGINLTENEKEFRTNVEGSHLKREVKEKSEEKKMRSGQKYTFGSLRTAWPVIKIYRCWSSLLAVDNGRSRSGARFRKAVKRACGLRGADVARDHILLIIVMNITLKKFEKENVEQNLNLDNMEKLGKEKVGEIPTKGMIEEKKENKKPDEENIGLFYKSSRESQRLLKDSRAKKTWITTEMLKEMKKRRKYKNGESNREMGHTGVQGGQGLISAIAWQVAAISRTEQWYPVSTRPPGYNSHSRSIKCEEYKTINIITCAAKMLSRVLNGRLKKTGGMQINSDLEKEGVDGGRKNSYTPRRPQRGQVSPVFESA
ncbi:hypothetical protein J437_LFUL015798 [Ladona fulva]|uniref:Uncharacterized protein n=1 Tax=Ladona fulva TaxID=123851 RepID=A0A8K0PAG7_LADFU|nr:hypothetical protein J437_LFUL015798 [Ladona fulva]